MLQIANKHRKSEPRMPALFLPKLGVYFEVTVMMKTKYFELLPFSMRLLSSNTGITLKEGPFQKKIKQ